MIQDFFLFERAAQIQRLSTTLSGNCLILPSRPSRFGYSSQAVRLFRTMDKIRKMQLVERRKSWFVRLYERGGRMLGGARSQSPVAEDSLLKAAERTTLEGFESQVVQLRLASDAKSRNVAEEIVRVIMSDQTRFSGLKPLQFHSDNFTHEFLFPSWLNLYTAIAQARNASKEPGYSEEQVRTLFAFLQAFENDNGPADELVAALSLTINRLPPEEALPMVQRLVDLGCSPDRSFRAAYVARIGWLREHDDSVAGFLRLLRNWSAFELSAGQAPPEPAFLLLTGVPRHMLLPPVIVDCVRTLENEPTEFNRWCKLLERIAIVIEGVDGFDGEFVDLLARQADRIGDWLDILAPAPGSALSVGCQRLLARMARCEELGSAHQDDNLLLTLGQKLAGRLNVLDGPGRELFEAEYIVQDSNRQMLLESIRDQSPCGTLVQSLLEQASQTTELLRLARQLLVAAVLDLRFDMTQLSRMTNTLAVLRIVAEQGFISSQQMELLSSSIRERLPDSIAFLAAPYLGAADQDTRVAKLFLALSEEVEKYEHSGQVGNFGLTSAAYGILNRDISGGSSG